ncbi:MAG: hypothetical protein MK135_08465 [Polyangiaceae bacterium]|nr:hypothetical protein [Polyangiaceae bacterium]
MAKELKSYRLELVDAARIVARGEEVSVWYIRQNDGWIRAKDHPGVQLDTSVSENQDTRCPAGTVWQRQMELRVAPKTLLFCRTTSPQAIRLNVAQYLEQERPRAGRQNREHFYLVAGNYRKVALERDEAIRLIQDSKRAPSKG